MKKNERGITLITIIVVGIIIILLLFFIYGGFNKGKARPASTSSSTTTTSKEARSTYIQKCSTIDYKSLARNPNQYKGKDYVFTGEVIQVMNNNNEVMLRVNVTEKRYEYIDEVSYEDTILVYYKYENSYESRILEDDIITIYGQSLGTYTYESTFGAAITVPAVNAMYIDIKTK